jgi:hypothetical protein
MRPGALKDERVYEFSLGLQLIATDDEREGPTSARQLSGYVENISRGWALTLATVAGLEGRGWVTQFSGGGSLALICRKTPPEVLADLRMVKVRRPVLTAWIKGNAVPIRFGSP